MVAVHVHETAGVGIVIAMVLVVGTLPAVA